MDRLAVSNNLIKTCKHLTGAFSPNALLFVFGEVRISPGRMTSGHNSLTNHESTKGKLKQSQNEAQTPSYLHIHIYIYIEEAPLYALQSCFYLENDLQYASKTLVLKQLKHKLGHAYCRSVQMLADVPQEITCHGESLPQV